MANLVEVQGGAVQEILETTDSANQQAQAGLGQIKQAAASQSGCIIC